MTDEEWHAQIAPPAPPHGMARLFLHMLFKKLRCAPPSTAKQPPLNDTTPPSMIESCIDVKKRNIFQHRASGFFAFFEMHTWTVTVAPLSVYSPAPRAEEELRNVQFCRVTHLEFN